MNDWLFDNIDKYAEELADELPAEESVDIVEDTSDGKYRYLPVGGRTNSTVSRPQLDKLSSLVEEKLKQAAGDLAAGNIDADPFWRGDNHNACLWCDYASACHFEPACGDKLRRQRELKAEEFWASLNGNAGEEETDGH